MGRSAQGCEGAAGVQGSEGRGTGICRDEEERQVCVGGAGRGTGEWAVIFCRQ